jgi:hypothetical protein
MRTDKRVEADMFVDGTATRQQLRHHVYIKANGRLTKQGQLKCCVHRKGCVLQVNIHEDMNLVEESTQPILAAAGRDQWRTGHGLAQQDQLKGHAPQRMQTSIPNKEA